MLSCLPWLTSGSTANWTPGSGSMDSAGSTGSFSDDSVTIMHECDAIHALVRCYAYAKKMHEMICAKRCTRDNNLDMQP